MMLKMGMQPAHPGEIIKEMYLGPLNLTITETANALGVARKNLSAIVNDKAGISTDMSVRLSEAFNTSTDLWVGLQKDYDVWHSEKVIDRGKIEDLYNSMNAVFYDAHYCSVIFHAQQQMTAPAVQKGTNRLKGIFVEFKLGSFELYIYALMSWSIVLQQNQG